MGFSLTHILILAIVLLLLVGPNRIPKVGQGIGRAIRGFKDGLNGTENETQNRPPPRSVGSNRPDELGSPESTDAANVKQAEKNRQS